MQQQQQQSTNKLQLAATKDLASHKTAHSSSNNNNNSSSSNNNNSNNNPNASNNPSTSDNLNNTKSESVAKLVMSMKAHATPAFGTSSEPQSELNSASNSVESDKEVEEITSRASKVDLRGSSKANDQNNNSGTRLSETSSSSTTTTTTSVESGSQKQQSLISSAIHGSMALAMPGLISGEPISAPLAARQQILSPSKLNLDSKQQRRQRQQSSSKESVAKCELEPASSSSNSISISLDTKVPHPSAGPVEASTASGPDQASSVAVKLFPGGAGSSCSNSIEEVSYYNDQSSVSQPDVKQQAKGPSAASNNRAASSAPTSASSSSSCNNKPKSSQQTIPLGSSSGSGSSSKPKPSSGSGSGSALVSEGGAGRPSQRAKPLAGREPPKLSISLAGSALSPPGSFVCGSAAANQQTALALDVCSREYCNDFNDDYDTRYDTAATEDSAGEQADDGSDRTPTGRDFESHSSPKAKSAPATPCNVTPTAFHQHNSNNKSNLPNPANTLPVDTRRNISATCRMLPSSISLAHAHQSNTFTNVTNTPNDTSSSNNSNSNNNNNNIININNNNNNGQQLTSAVSEQYLDNLVEEAESLFRHDNYVAAIENFSQCIGLATQSGHFDYLRKNFRIYSQRAEGYFKLGKYGQAIEDSMAARELSPKWAQAHYILGKAQFNLDKHIDSLTAFSFGLAQVPDSKLLFEALVSAALNSSYPKLANFEDNFGKLRERDLDKDQFVVVATLGQELLSKHHHQHAAIVLESALKLGTDNKRFKSSVLSTTSHVFCAIGDYKKALAYMRLELEIERELNDVSGQCRVLSNIGHTYYKMAKFSKSLEAHRQQLKLAIANNLHQQAAQAFNATGHVHVARNDLANARTSHEGCLIMLRSLGQCEFEQFKELLALGHVNALLAEYKASEERYKEAIQVLDSSANLKKDEHQTGSIMAHFNLAYLALKQQSPMEATKHYESVIRIAKDMEPGNGNQKRLLYQIRALSGLGHTCRISQRFDEARNYFTRQLELARKVNDLSSRSQALCNLAMTYQHFKNYDLAWKLFDENMLLVADDKMLKAYAHSYRGSMHFLWGEYTKAHEEYEKSLQIFKELEHCCAERKTIELNMDAVSERLGRSQMSLASNTGRVQRKVVMAQ